MYACMHYKHGRSTVGMAITAHGSDFGPDRDGQLTYPTYKTKQQATILKLKVSQGEQLQKKTNKIITSGKYKLNSAKRINIKMLF